MALRTYRIPASQVPAATKGVQHPGSEMLLVIRGDKASVDDVEHLVETLSGPPALGVANAVLRALIAARRRAGRDQEIIGRLMPEDVSSAAHALQLQRNAAARTEALEESGSYTAAELAAARGSHTANPHATVGRWLRDGLLFAVDGPQGRLFPAFQIAEARPKPAMARVLAALPTGLGGWEILLWFRGSNGRLGGERPVDLLDHDPDLVVDAAEYLADSLAD